MKTFILLTGLFLIVTGVQMITGAHQAAAGVLARKVRAFRRRLAGRSFPARVAADPAASVPFGVLERADGVILYGPDGVRVAPDRPRRPVNGRSRGTQPHIAIPPGHPPWLTAPMPAVRVVDDRPFEHPGDGLLPPVPLIRPYMPMEDR